MRRFRRIIPVCLLIVFATFLLVGCGSDKDFVSNTQELKDGLTEIDIEVDSANVIIEQGEEAAITYNFPAKDKVSLTYENGVVKFEVKEGFSLFSSGADKEVKVTIPKDKELAIIKVETDSGNININNIKCEQITAEVDSGNINMANDIAKKLIVKADSGNINVNGQIENTDADVDTGNVTLEGDIYIVKAESDSGDIVINSIKSQSQMRLELNTNFGDIIINGKFIGS